MEDVQSWWEVPAITHFCSVFRAAFNLIYFDVEELEAAILNMQDPEISISLDQLITKLLEGCYDEGEVKSFNWEEKLKELFDGNLDEEENILNDSSFHSLTPRLKVEVLFKLCHIRLDVAAAEDLIKDIPAEHMQAKCIGQDSEKYSYWYFSDERLYKESLNAAKQNSVSKKKKVENVPVKNGSRRQGARNIKPVVVPPSDIPWSIVCFNLNDWEKLAQKFSKSKNASEKELAKEIKTHYLENITKIVNEKERLLRKRLLELAPKRTSSRICKVQAAKKLEEQMAAEAEEERKREKEKELSKQAALRKIQEKEDRRKRAEERSKIIEERAKRVAQRGMLKNFVDDYQDSNDSKYDQRNDSGESYSENESDEKDRNEQSSASEEDEGDDAELSCSDENESNESESDNEEESDCDSEDTNGRSYIRQDVIHTYDLAEWNSTIDTKGQRLHILQTAPSDDISRKRLRVNEAGNYKVSKLNGLNSVTQKENHNRQSYHTPNGNSYTSVAPQHYIKIDILKPATKQASN